MNCFFSFPRFIDKFFEENPLSCCAEEISRIKSKLTGEDKLKLSQKNRSITLAVWKDKYFLKAKFTVPPDYPETRIGLDLFLCSFGLF